MMAPFCPFRKTEKPEQAAQLVKPDIRIGPARQYFPQKLFPAAHGAGIYLPRKRRMETLQASLFRLKRYNPGPG